LLHSPPTAAHCFGALLAEVPRNAADLSDDELRQAQVVWATIDSPWLHKLPKRASREWRRQTTGAGFRSRSPTCSAQGRHADLCQTSPRCSQFGVSGSGWVTCPADNVSAGPCGPALTRTFLRARRDSNPQPSDP
jgi:hypothetical protein